jgi:hypothetical protein
MMLLGRGDGHLPPGEPLDTPSPREQQPLTPLADGRRGTASALALSEAENDRGYFYRRGMRGGARKHSYALFRGARQAKNSSSWRRQEVHLVDLGRRRGDGAPAVVTFQQEQIIGAVGEQTPEPADLLVGRGRGEPRRAVAIGTWHPGDKEHRHVHGRVIVGSPGATAPVASAFTATPSPGRGRRRAEAGWQSRTAPVAPSCGAWTGTGGEAPSPGSGRCRPRGRPSPSAA